MKARHPCPAVLRGSSVPLSLLLLTRRGAVSARQERGAARALRCSRPSAPSGPRLQPSAHGSAPRVRWARPRSALVGGAGRRGQWEWRCLAWLGLMRLLGVDSSLSLAGADPEGAEGAARGRPCAYPGRRARGGRARTAGPPSLSLPVARVFRRGRRSGDHVPRHLNEKLGKNRTR